MMCVCITMLSIHLGCSIGTIFLFGKICHFILCISVCMSMAVDVDGECFYNMDKPDVMHIKAYMLQRLVGEQEGKRI